MRKLPPLNALKAFEAAARHGSFVAAADELAVTPAAVSHQVKGLEEHLGQPLFTRQHRAVVLTEAGKRLLPGLTEGFTRLADSVDEVMSYRRTGPVVVSCTPSFAAKWLLPRLEGFLQRYPEHSVRVDADARLVDLEAEEVDLAIRFTTKPDLEAERLFGDTVFPVCAPRLRVGLRTVADLAMQTLIYDELFERVPNSGSWEDWFKAAGLPALKPARTLHYSHTTLALDAAMRGQGVALGRSLLVAGDLALGTLVRPFETSITAGASYHLVRLSGRPVRPAAAAFREWLVDEAAAFRRQNPGLVI